MIDKKKLRIRTANVEDADAIVSLSEELGYQPTLQGIKDRISNFSFRDDQKIYVADCNEILGWVHVSIVESLESIQFGEIRGLIVREDSRRTGIGSKLIESAEKWVKDKGCSRIRIRTNVKRVETVSYFKKIGLTLLKTQEVFEKTI